MDGVELRALLREVHMLSLYALGYRVVPCHIQANRIDRKVSSFHALVIPIEAANVWDKCLQDEDAVGSESLGY